MIVTEVEARERWCPFARVIFMGTGSTGNLTAVGNRGGAGVDPASPDGAPNPPASRCIASECMAWEWERADVMAGVAAKTFGHCALMQRAALHVSAVAS